MHQIAALFARSDSIYKTMPGVDVWDIDRDALKWPGGCPVIAHPPCRAWGRLRAFANPRPGEKDLALWAVDQVRKWGGVLEHPHASSLWPAANLPTPGRFDNFGGWTLGIHQNAFGHRAEKRTLLYIVGCAPRNLPPIPHGLNYPTHVIQTNRRAGGLPHVSRAEREATPPALADWLCQVARSCQVQPQQP